MKKAIILLLIASLTWFGYLIFRFHVEEGQAKERREESHARDAHLTRASDTCKAAIAATLKPKRILDFPVEIGFTGIRYTTTGFSYGIVADTGTEKHRVKCYMSEDYQIIDLIRN